MTTVKIKFRPSTVDGSEGSIFYQVIHNRVARQKKTVHRLHSYEWNKDLSEIILPDSNGNRKRYLSEINERIQTDIRYFHKIISDFEHNAAHYTADDVIAAFTMNIPTCVSCPMSSEWQ